MDIPRTYLEDVARAALSKINPAEPPQSVVDEAVVELQSVMNLIARNSNAADLFSTPFEHAAAEALAEMPLNEWVIKWRQAQKAEHQAAKAASEAAEAAAEASRVEHAARVEAEAAEAARVKEEAKAAAEAAAAAVKAEAEAAAAKAAPKPGSKGSKSSSKAKADPPPKG